MLFTSFLPHLLLSVMPKIQQVLPLWPYFLFLQEAISK